MYITQISVYLENDHGTLRTLTKTLADAGIDMLGMSIADTANFGIARIVVREADFNGAITALINAGFMARKNWKSWFHRWKTTFASGLRFRFVSTLSLERHWTVRRFLTPWRSCVLR